MLIEKLLFFYRNGFVEFLLNPCGISETFFCHHQGVGIGFDTYLDGAAGFVGINVVQCGVGCFSCADNIIDHAVSGCIVSAFETGKIQHGNVWVAGGELGGPDFLNAVHAVVFRPYVLDFQR